MGIVVMASRREEGWVSQRPRRRCIVGGLLLLLIRSLISWFRAVWLIIVRSVEISGVSSK